MARHPSRSHSRGFSLVELAIAVGIIVVLSVMVLVGARYLVEDARQRDMVATIDGLRNGARQYSKRVKNGLSFVGLGWDQSGCPGTPPAALPGIPAGCSLKTPWGSTKIALQPESSATGCAGGGCFKICMEVSTAADCTYCETLRPAALAGNLETSCDNGNSPAQCSLGGGNCKLLIVGR